MRIKTIRNFSYLFSLGLMFCLSNNAFAEEEELITTIILINGQAELVDVNKSGDVLKRIISVPEYFKTSRSHGSLVKKSIARANSLSEESLNDNPAEDIVKVEENQASPNPIIEPELVPQEKQEIFEEFCTSNTPYIDTKLSEQALVITTNFSSTQVLPIKNSVRLTLGSVPVSEAQRVDPLAAIYTPYTFLLLTLDSPLRTSIAFGV